MTFSGAAVTCKSLQEARCEDAAEDHPKVVEGIKEDGRIAQQPEMGAEHPGVKRPGQVPHFGQGQIS